jgi:hypothetical protein
MAPDAIADAVTALSALMGRSLARPAAERAAVS